jgi:endonuclease-3
MLSSRTKDEVTAEAVRNLQNNNLSIKMIDEIELSELNKLISKVGFHNNKAIFLKKAARMIIEEY